MKTIYDSNNKNIFNHVCQKENNQIKGVCKVNLYPFDTGCLNDSMCFENSKCINSKGSFEISIDTGLSFYFTDDKINWGDINGFISSIGTSYYEIVNWDTDSKKGNLIPALTTSSTSILEKGKNYQISLGNGQSGICIEDIPAGGPANLTLGGISIPCREGLKNIENYCLDQNNPRIGQVCINDNNIPNLKCGTSIIAQYKGKNIKVQPSCLYDDAVEKGLLNDYYYNIDKSYFKVYQVGKCTVENAQKDEACDNTYNGCKTPFICLQENDINGTPISICNTPFQSQICINDQCPEGRECSNPDGDPPLCKSKPGFTGFVDSDCISNSLTNYALQIFDPKTGKLFSAKKNLTDISPSIPANLRLSSPGICNQIYPGTSEVATPNPIIIWNLPEENLVFLQRLKDNNIENMSIQLPENNYKVEDIVIDQDENLLFLYRRPVNDTMRERIMPILRLEEDIIILPDNNGLADNTIVYYINKSTQGDLVSREDIYKLSMVDDHSFRLNDSNTGLSIKLANINFSANKHFIVTYNNDYVVSSNSSNKLWQLSPNYNFSGEINEAQINTGDHLLFNGTGVSFKSFLPSETSSVGAIRTIFNEVNSGNNFNYYPTIIGNGLSGNSGNYNSDQFLFTDGVLPTNSIEYVLGDEYYHSVGGYPVINNTKVFHQQIVGLGSQNSNYFTLNGTSFYTYGITLIPFQNNSVFTFKEPRYILNYNQGYTINGINRGITYLYNEEDKNIKITTKKINNQNYLVLNKGIQYTTEGGTSSRYINHLLEYKYDINSEINIDNNFFDINVNYDNRFITNGDLKKEDGNIISYKSTFLFTLDKTVAQNMSKGFYFNNIKSMENNIDNVSLNDNNSLFYTLTHNNKLNNNRENSIAINSKYEKINYIRVNSKYEPTVEYNQFSDFDNLRPLKFSNITQLGTSAYQKGTNYYIPEENYIYIYNQRDIDNILNFSSSELVLTKESPNPGLQYNESLQDYKLKINFSRPQLTWALVNIEEYNVNIDSEYMKIKIHVNIQRNDITYKSILDSDNEWLLHVYNFVPLNNYHLNISREGQSPVGTYNYFINDASLLYSSTKGTCYIDNNKLNISRTGYNKLFMPTAGKNTPPENALPEKGNFYSIYNIHDGAGAKMNNSGVSNAGIDNLGVEISSYSDPDKFYDIETCLFFYSTNRTGTTNNVDHNITTYPSSIPWQYFLQKGDFITSNLISDSTSGTNNYSSPTGNTSITSFNNLASGRFFLSFIPYSNSSLQSLKNSNQLSTTNLYPVSDNGNSAFINKQPGQQQFVIDSKVSNDSNILDSTAMKQIYTGIIRLPYANYDGNLYTCNDLFASSLPLGDNFFINSSPIVHDNIVVSSYKDKEGNLKLKNLGNISLFQNAMAHYQTDTKKEPEFFNETNQIAISWPSWVKTRYNNDSKEIPIIKKVIIDHNNGNVFGQATYYAFVEFSGKTSLVYLNNENSNFDLAENQGIPTTVSIYNNQISNNILGQAFVMSSPSRFLYILSRVCN